MRQDRLLALLSLASLVLVGLHVAYKRQPSADDLAMMSRIINRPELWRGKIAPDFELTTLEGERFALADRVGHEVVVLNFFATWCGPCRTEMPELNRLADQLRGRPFTLLGIDANEKRELVEEFVQEHGVGYPVAIDEGNEVGTQLGVESYPTTILIDQDGRIAMHQSGAITNVDVAFAGVLETALRTVEGGRGTSKDAYLAAAATEVYPARPPASPSPDEDARLGERGRRIAAAMDCPCGCDHKVEKCGCRTSKRLRARLATLEADPRTDADLMQELNREFCMEAME